jgi:hypothetical protein
MAKTSGQLEKERVRQKAVIGIRDFTKCYYGKFIVSLLILFSIGLQSNAQSDFNLGFSDGYKIGYCYNQGDGCFLHITTPFAPIPNFNESSESYLDGYNRGLLLGINAREKNELKTKQSSQVYGQPYYIPQLPSFKPDWSFYQKVLNQSEQNYKELEKSKRTDKVDEMVKWFMENNTPEKVQKRKEYIKLLKAYYSEQKIYPPTTPNGIYKVTAIYESANYPDFDEGEAVVENNKMTSFKFQNDEGVWHYMFDIEKFPLKLHILIKLYQSFLRIVYQFLSKKWVKLTPILIQIDPHPFSE